MPLVGASGGISGVIGYCALRFPRARLSVPILWWLATRPERRLPALG